MVSIRRIRNRLIAKVLSRFPGLSQRYSESYRPRESGDVPWTPFEKPLDQATFALVTTAGVHHLGQRPFDMQDPDGDPSLRIIDTSKPLSDLTITHDYYDHADADRDINVVFPIERLRELRDEGVIGGVAETHYGFMGHIDGRHVRTLIEVTAPEAAAMIASGGIDAVLLTPG